MQRKPWPIILLALFQCLLPIADVSMGARILDVTAWEYLESLFRLKDFPELVEFFGVTPLAGYAIFRVQRWSYPVFLGCVLWGALAHLERWQNHSQDINLYFLFGYYLLNCVCVSFFLLKQVRSTYYNPRNRWWESKPRYILNAPAQYKVDDEINECTLINISEGGAHIKTSEEISLHSRVTLFYNCLGKNFLFQGETLHRIQNQKNGYGIQFVIPYKKRAKILNLIQALEVLGIDRRPVRVHWAVSLVHWLRDLFIDGKGLLPEIPMVHMGEGISNPDGTRDGASHGASNDKNCRENARKSLAKNLLERSKVARNKSKKIA